MKIKFYENHYYTWHCPRCGIKNAVSYQNGSFLVGIKCYRCKKMIDPNDIKYVKEDTK